MTLGSPPTGILRAGNILGEGISWDARTDQLWWTDIQGRHLHRYDWGQESLSVYDTPERVGSFGFVSGSQQLIVAFASGIALYDVAAQEVEWIARPAEVAAGVRFNDGRVDRHGRFWCGTMVEGKQAGADACLYSVGRGGIVRCHLRGVRIANGLCVSPDGKLLYFADSPTRTIHVYDLIEPDGLLGNRRIFAHTEDGAFPDGATVDTDGCVWVAHWGAGCVVRYSPDGRIDRRIQVPASQPSCVCFGGPELDVLCVTTARDGLSEEELRSEPDAGSVFMYRTGVQGLPEPEFLP